MGGLFVFFHQKAVVYELVQLRGIFRCKPADERLADRNSFDDNALL